jgi:hypothetical protein
VNDKVQGEGNEVSARRRLIRGAFAAPAALTLYSGSALAVASNRRCVQNDSQAGQSPQASMGADTWVRVQLHTLADSLNPQIIDSSWLYGAALDLLLEGRPTDTSNRYLSSSLYECYNVEAGSSYAAGNRVPSPAKANYELRQNGSFVAVRVDADGNIVGIVKATNDTSKEGAVHRSCWTSFKP